MAPFKQDQSATGAAPPETIGRYRLLSKIAKGGMAEVYAARSYGAHGFEKTVALKRILPKFGHDPQFVRMMIDEAKISVLLNHPNIAQVFELGEQDGDYFIVMEFVPGQSLSALIKRMKEEGIKLGVHEACFIVVELLQGLHAAHTQEDALGNPAKIIHRDVSPQNTLLSFDGHVKVIDFGIARARDRLEATEIGTIKGKLRYLAPEMIDPGRFTNDGDFDHRVDVFAAGIVLWELLANRPLFPGDDELKVYDDITDGKTPDLTKEGIDPALMKIVKRSLERELKPRYASAEAFADELRAYVYRNDPSFTHKRVAAVLDKIFAEEKQELLALERGAAPVVSGAVPKAQPSRPNPASTGDGHTRSDRQLPGRDKEGPRANAEPKSAFDMAATAIADSDGLAPRQELAAARDVTVMTLVSREGILAGVDRSPSDQSSGVFSAADDATLTVSAETAAVIKEQAGVKAGPRPPMRPNAGAVFGAPTVVAPARARPSPDETPMTAQRDERSAGPVTSEADGRRGLVIGSIAVGVLLALIIVAAVDRLVPERPAPPPPTTALVDPAPPTIVSPPAPGPAPTIVAPPAPDPTPVVLVPVRLDVTPLDAVVTIDGVVASATAQLEAGRTVTVSVSAEGYEALTAQKLVEPPELLIAAALKAAGAVAPSPAPAPPPPAPAPQIVKKPPQPPPVQAKGAGTLQLKTTPYWAQVTIDGRTYDEVTPMSVQLAAGRHEVTLSNPAKGVTKKVKVVVVADETTSRMIELE